MAGRWECHPSQATRRMGRIPQSGGDNPGMVLSYMRRVLDFDVHLDRARAVQHA